MTPAEDRRTIRFTGRPLYWEANGAPRANVISFSAFEVVLVGEAQGDAVAVAPGGPAVLGDAGAETRHAASLHAEVAFRAVACV